MVISVTVTTTVRLTQADVGRDGTAWDLARQPILDAKVLDRNVTWLTKHKDTRLIQAQDVQVLGFPCSSEH